MSDPNTPEYAALFKENEDKINSKMTGLFYQTNPDFDNKWAKLTVPNLRASVESMNGEYLRKVLLGTETDQEKKYLDKLQAELARRIKAEEEGKKPREVTSLFGDNDVIRE